jgi:chromosome segregation ATPase
LNVREEPLLEHNFARLQGTSASFQERIERERRNQQEQGKHFYYELNLEGNLAIKDFPNLQEINVIGQNLTNLSIESPSLTYCLVNKNANLTELKLNCPNLERIVYKESGRIRLDLSQCEKITAFSLDTDLDSEQVYLVSDKLKELDLTRQGEVNHLNTQLENKTNQLAQAQQTIGRLEQQVNTWQGQINELKEEKNALQRSTEYLRETSKKAEKDLEEIQQQLASAQTNAQATKQAQDNLLTQKEEELRQRQEAFKVISERNTDLQTKLTTSQSEITKLSEWISKLESMSAEGDAFAQLKQELASAHHKVQELQEQLNVKGGKSY